MPLFSPPPTIAVEVGARNLAGFTNTNTDTTLTWTNGTRTIAVAPTGANFTVWANNTGYTFTGSQTTQIANVVGQHFVIFDASGTLTSSTTPWDITTDQAAPVAIVYWDGTNGAVADERHSAQRDRWNHADLHNTRGTAYANGLAGSFNNANFSVAPGVIYDEELKLNLPNTYTTCRLWYRKAGATEMTFESAVANVYKASGTSLQFDNAGTLTTVTTTGGGNYVTNWVYATDDITYPIYCVVSQAQYNTLAQARAATTPTFPNITTREWKLIYTVIYRNPAGVAAFIEATDYRTVSTLPGAVVTSLPAASVTFTPIDGITAGNVQVAFSQVAPLTSGIADSASAVGVTFNTAATYSTAGSKLLSLQNNTTETAYFDYKGALHILATSTDTLSNVSLHLKAAIPIMSLEGTAGTGRTFAITNNYAGANLMQFTYSTTAGGAATNIAMTIDDAGKIGMGITPTGGRLHLAGDVHTLVEIDGTTSARVRLAATTATAGTRNFEFQSGGGTFKVASLNDSWGLYTNQYILNAGPDGSIGFNTATINTAGYTFVSPMANSGSAIGMLVNTAVAYTTTSKLFSAQNNSVEKFYIDNTGSAFATNHVVSGSSGNVYSGAGGFFANSAVTAQFRGGVADAANAVAVAVDNINTLSTNTTRLLSIRNNTVEKTWFGPTGSAYFTAGEVNSDLYQSVSAAAVTLSGQVADGATAVGAIIKNSTTLSTSGAKIASFRNATVEKAYVDKDGLGSFSSINQGGQPAADQAGVFYVRRYGAVGDGTHDDLPAFQATVAAAYAWAQQYTSGSQTGSNAVPGAKVVTGSGLFRLVGNLDLTVGDPLGGGPTYYGMGRVTLEGMGRQNTMLVFENGTTIDGLSVGGYTSVTDMTIKGVARTMVKSIPNAGATNVGRSAERLYMRRVFITGTPDTANNYVSLDLPGVFWATLDTVYAPYGLKAGVGGSGANCYGVNLINCQIANYAVNTTPSLTLHGSLFNIDGGLIYSVNPSTTPAILLEEGTMVAQNIDMAYTGVNATTGYDIVIGGGSSFGATKASVFGCNFPVRTHTAGTTGNIYVRSNVTGGEIGQNVYGGTPSIDIENGASGLTINDASISSSSITYNSSTDLSAYVGNIEVTNVAQFNGHGVFQSVYVGLGLGAVATNTAVGVGTLAANTTGEQNTAIGYQALTANTTGVENTAVGWSALVANISGGYNTSIGRRTMYYAEAASRNTALGYAALRYTRWGDQNTAIGESALGTMGTERDTVDFHVGHTYQISIPGTLDWTTIGAADSNVGTVFVTTGNPTSDGKAWPYNTFNVAVGSGAGDGYNDFIDNVLIGYNAGSPNTSEAGDNNILIGANSILPTSGANNQTVIGNASTVAATMWGTFTSYIGSHVMSTDGTVTGSGSNGHLRIIDTNYVQLPFVEVSNFNLKFGDATNGYTSVGTTTGTYYGNWDSGTTYATGERVNWNANHVYESLQNSNTNHEPPLGGDTWWTESTAGTGLQFYSNMAADEASIPDYSFITHNRTAGVIFRVTPGYGNFEIAHDGVVTIPGALTFTNGAYLQSDMYTLDRYSEFASDTANAKVPWIEFGGSYTGITYSTQKGGCTTIGDMEFINVSLVLTSKGSQTGAATISGAVNNNPLLPTPCVLYMTDVSSGGNAVIQAYLHTDGKIYITQLAANGTVTNITNSQFINTTTVKVSCSYQIATA